MKRANGHALALDEMPGQFFRAEIGQNEPDVQPHRTYNPRAMPGADASATASQVLLERIRAGDTAALNTLLQRYLPRLSRWASGRLPQWARDMSETADLVQETLARAATSLHRFENRGEGALQAYLRTAVKNRIRDEIRRTKRSKTTSSLDTSSVAEAVDEGQSPLEAAIGRELLEKYDAALDRLDSETREAVIARIEMGCSYAEIAEALGKSSPDAARMTVSRALLRLAREMRHGR